MITFKREAKPLHSSPTFAMNRSTVGHFVSAAVERPS